MKNHCRKKTKAKKPSFDFKKFDYSKLKKILKPTIIIVIVIALFFACVFGIGGAIKSSKTAYIHKYEKKYTDVSFPSGIMEKYCDLYGQNPNMAGYITISDIKLKSPVLVKADGKNPYAEASEKGAKTTYKFCGIP